MKVTLYTFYSLEDYVMALDIIEKELKHQEELIDGLYTEMASVISNDPNIYHIQVTLQHETEN